MWKQRGWDGKTTPYVFVFRSLRKFNKVTTAHIEPINVQEINCVPVEGFTTWEEQQNKENFILFGDHVTFYNRVRPRGLIKEDERRREAGPSPRNQGTSDTLWSGSSGGVVRSIEGCWSYCSGEAQQRAVQGRSRLCHISSLETALILLCSEAQTREGEMYSQ